MGHQRPRRARILAFSRVCHKTGQTAVVLHRHAPPRFCPECGETMEVQQP